jgi:hypothetical protein
VRKGWRQRRRVRPRFLPAEPPVTPQCCVYVCVHAEGISYLVIVATVAYSLYTKVQTGKGLPAGPAGLLGAVEGFSYLSLLGGRSSSRGGKVQEERESGSDEEVREPCTSSLLFLAIH